MTILRGMLSDEPIDSVDCTTGSDEPVISLVRTPGPDEPVTGVMPCRTSDEEYDDYWGHVVLPRTGPMSRSTVLL